MLSLILPLLPLISAASHPGLRTSLHESSLQTFLSSYIPQLLGSIQAEGMGSFSFPLNLLVARVTLNVTHTNFAMLEVNMQETCLEMDYENQTIWLKIRGLSMDLESDFKYHTLATGWTDGKFYLYMEDASLTIPMTIGVDEEGKLDCKIETIEQSFLDMEYQFSTDSYLMDILAFLGSIPPFNYVDTLITNLLFAKSISTLGTQMHKFLQEMPYETTIGPMSVDYHFYEFNITKDSYLEAAINGTVYPTGSKAAVPYSPPEEEDWLTSKEFRLQISQYTLDSMAWAVYLTNFFRVNVTANMLPKSVPFALSTTGLAMLIPQLIKQYGPNKPVELRCQASQQPLLTVSSLLDASLYGLCDVVVHTNTTAEALAMTLQLQIDTQVNFTLFSSSKASYIIGALNTTATQLSQFAYTVSNIGPVDLSSLKVAFSTLIKLAAGIVNAKYLSQGVALPLPAGVLLSNASAVAEASSIIELAAQPSFNLMAQRLIDELYT